MGQLATSTGSTGKHRVTFPVDFRENVASPRGNTKYRSNTVCCENLRHDIVCTSGSEIDKNILLHRFICYHDCIKVEHLGSRDKRKATAISDELYAAKNLIIFRKYILSKFLQFPGKLHFLENMILEKYVSAEICFEEIRQFQRNNIMVTEK